MKKHCRSLFINASAFILTAGLIFGNTSSRILAAAEDTSGEGISDQDEGSMEFWQDLFGVFGLSSEKTVGERIAEANTSTVFIGDPFYDGTIENEDDALDAIYSVMDRLGGDENTELVFHDVFENDEDAVEQADMARVEVPEVPRGGQAIASLTLPFDPEELGADVTMYLMRPEDEELIYVWKPKNSITLAAVVPGGDYLALMSVSIRNQENAVSYFFLTDSGWVAAEGGMAGILADVAARGLDSMLTHFNAGEVTELTTDGL